MLRCLALLASPLLALSLGVAHAAVPAPMIGSWTLEGRPPGVSQDASPTVQLFISGGTLRGSIGCGRFTGTLSVTSGRVALHANALPPAPNERCLYAADGPFLRQLGASTRFVAARDRLVLISGSARLAFKRVGFVTPVKP